MPQLAITPAEINQRGRQFWVEQSELLRERMQEEKFRDYAFKELSLEQLRLPIYYQRTLEALFERAEQVIGVSNVTRARRAAKASRPDALQVIIEEIVKERPKISANDVRGKLNEFVGQGRITSAGGGGILYIAGGARRKSFKLTSNKALASRVSRAKKKFAPAS